MDPRLQEFWLRLGTAALCGAIIGLERQLKGKAAGIRTSMLVCIGTCVFVRLGADVAGTHTDPTRVLGQVVTGIGFLGAGVIMNQGGLVKGLTSAAVIWVLAAIGACAGLDQLHAAGALSLVTVGILVGVELLEHTFKKLRRGAHSDELPTEPAGPS